MARVGSLALAPLLDCAALVAFVAIGQHAHNVHSGGFLFFVVLWPLIVGWFAAALVFRVYADAAPSWGRVGMAWAVGMALALVLRTTITGRPAPLPFIVVLLLFTAVSMVGWRVLARLALSRRYSRQVQPNVCLSGDGGLGVEQ